MAARTVAATACTAAAIVVFDGEERSAELDYGYPPTLYEVIFELLQAGTPAEARGLGTTVESRIVWTLPGAGR